MYLEKLVINGFKSFAEETVFVFDQPLVSIVGPNGSGKTNVSDAMRWVMGEQSLKLMRLKKHGDAIFAGSQQRGRLGMAQVDLHINNEDGRLPIDYRTVTISRRLVRNGDSEYLINNNPVRLQDIILLLAQANFGQKSYGVIGQGMITDILNANPQDRKNFFDEATGVKEFQIKRDQAINKLIRTEQNVIRVDDLLQEIKPRLQSLERQVKKLEQRQTIETKLNGVYVDYYGSLLMQLNEQLTALQQQRTDLAAQHSLLDNTLTTIEHDIDIIGKGESRVTLYQQLQLTYNETNSEKNDLLKELAILKGRLEVEHERSGDIELLWLQRRQDEINRTMSEHEEQITILQDAIAHLETQRTKTQLAHTEVQTTITTQQQELTATQQEILNLSEVLSVPEIKGRLKNLFDKQEQFLRDILNTASLNEFKTVQEQAKAITEQLADLLDELHTDRAEDIAIKQHTIKSLEARVQKSASLKDKLDQDITELRVIIESKHQTTLVLKDTIKKLKAELQDITNQRAALEETTITTSDDDRLQQAMQDIEQKLQNIDGTLTSKKHELDQFNQAEDAKKQRLVELQTEARKIQADINHVTNQLQSIDIELTRLHTKHEDLLQDVNRTVDAATQELIMQWSGERSDYEQLRVTIEKLQHQLNLIGGIDPEIVQEHDTTQERYQFLDTQSKDLNHTIHSLEQVIDELDETIQRQFNKSFKTIAKNFEKYFMLLFNGGEAKLEMLTVLPVEEDTTTTTATDSANSNPDTTELVGKRKKKQRVISGIDIIAQPPGKKLQTVNALSGGEKSMTAIALLCAIIDANTPPFVVLDEVEAALDESNSEKFSAIIKHLAQKTQFVVITHNRATMRSADVLYGVTMAKDGTSHILSVKMSEAEQLVDDNTKTQTATLTAQER